MASLLRALILEDSENDVRLLLRELRRGDFELDYRVVDNANALKAALADQEWDVILSDYSMPGFDASEALKIVQAQGFDIPFIIISGTVGEDTAVAAMKAGARDFFTKDKLVRLIPAVERELSEAQERRQRREADIRFSKVFHASPIGIVISRLADGKTLDINQRFTEMFGYTRDRIINKSAAELDLWAIPGQSESLVEQLRATGSVINVEIELRRASGERGYALLSAEVIELGNEPCILSMVYDITDRKSAEQEVAFQALLLNTVGQAVIATDMEGKVNYWNYAAEQLYGWPAEEVQGRNIMDINPAEESLSRAAEIMAQLTAGKTWTGEMLLRRRDGSTFPALITNALIHDKQGDLIGIVGVSSDITALKESERAVRESERFAESTLDALSAHIAILDATGTIIAVNQSWKDFAAANSSDSDNAYLGMNYLSVCAGATGAQTGDAAAVVVGIQAVMEKKQDTFDLEYACHSPDEQRWFVVTVTRFRGSGPLRVVVAHENVTLRKKAELSVQQYAKRLELLHEIDIAILRADQPATIAQAVLARLDALTEYDRISVITINQESEHYTVLATTSSHLDGFTAGTQYPIDNPALIENLQQNKPYIVNDLLTSAQRTASEEMLVAAGIQSYACVPLISSGKLLGSLNFRAYETYAFSDETLDVAREVAAQLAIAIENARLLEVEKRRNSELTALHQASLQLTGTMQLDTVLDTIIDYSILLVHANNAHVFLYDGKTLTFGAAQEGSTKQDAPLATPRPDGLTYTVARSGKRVIVTNMDEHPLYKNEPWQGAIIGLPLIVANDVKGVMSLAYTQPHHFSEHELRLLELLADQAAIAVHNVQLYRQIQHHAENLEKRVLERTKQLQSAKDRVEAILNNSSDYIILANVNGIIYQTNPSLNAKFGYLPDTLLFQPLTSLITERDVETFEATFRAVIQERTYRRVEVIAQRQDRTTFPADALLAAFSDDDTVGVVCSLRDITLQKQVEADLREALERERELNELKTNFTSVVSHEFRTPLAVILSSSEMLINYFDKMQPDRRIAKLKAISHQVQRLTQLMDSVLIITRSESVGFEFKPQQVDLVELCHQIIDDVQAGKGNAVVVNFEHHGGCTSVAADGFLFTHILQNLASNAVKYSTSGGIVHIQLTCEHRQIILRVEDQGIGIPLSHQSKLFESFQRASNVGQIQGTGIGLAIVKRAVTTYGGDIEFESVENQGTTFTIRLPVPDHTIA